MNLFLRDWLKKMAGYSDFAGVYDRLTENVDYERRSAYYLSLLNKYGIYNGILLDLACGTGSMSHYFCKAGFDVIGVDGSPEMLNEARNKAAISGDTVLLLCQNFTELDLFGTVQCTVCALDSLNHITDMDDLRETVRRVSLFTEEKGLFLFDVNTPYKHECVLGDSTIVLEDDDVYCVWQNQYDSSDLTVTISLDIFKERKNGTYERFSEDIVERAYTDSQLSAVLAEFGFCVLARFGELTEEIPSETEERVVYVCRKICPTGKTESVS